MVVAPHPVGMVAGITGPCKGHNFPSLLPGEHGTSGTQSSTTEGWYTTPREGNKNYGWGACCPRALHSPPYFSPCFLSCLPILLALSFLCSHTRHLMLSSCSSVSYLLSRPDSTLSPNLFLGWPVPLTFQQSSGLASLLPLARPCSPSHALPRSALACFVGSPPSPRCLNNHSDQPATFLPHPGPLPTLILGNSAPLFSSEHKN